MATLDPLTAQILDDMQAEDAQRRRPGRPADPVPAAPSGTVAALIAGTTAAFYLGAPVWAAASAGFVVSALYVRLRRQR